MLMLMGIALCQNTMLTESVPRKISGSTSFHQVQNLVHDMVRLGNETPVQLNCVQGYFFLADVYGPWVQGP